MVRNKVYDSHTRQFEAMLSKHFDNANVLTVCNATVGIMGTFYALGLSNAEIITTPLTWAGALSGLQMLQCEIKFAKIEEPSLTIDPESILPLITPKTKAVFTADFLGYPCRLDAIKEICNKHNLILIHDAASSIGSTYDDFYAGKFADVSIYSFGRNKPFTSNEGGCIVTENGDLFEKVIYNLAHPERQAITAENINPLALNTSMNSFAVDYGLSNFEEQMNKINYHQNFVVKTLKDELKDLLYFEKALPNFYKPFFNKPFFQDNLNDLPFTPINSQYGILPQVLKQYKIIQALCFPL